MVSNSNIAVPLAIQHRQRDTLTRTFAFERDGEPVDVSEWEFTFRIRVPNGNQPIEKTDEEGLSRPSVQKLKVDAFAPDLEPGRYVWELEVDLPTGEHRTLFSGSLTIVANETTE